MKLALALFQDRISPRFDVAPRMRVYKVEGKKIIHNKDIFCEEWNEMDRVQKLKDLRVDVLVCGAITNNLCEILLNNGTSVIPWMNGDAQDFLNNFLTHRAKFKVIRPNESHHRLKNPEHLSIFKKGGE